jgi:hypothetical protein
VAYIFVLESYYIVNKSRVLTNTGKELTDNEETRTACKILIESSD